MTATHHSASPSDSEHGHTKAVSHVLKKISSVLIAVVFAVALGGCAARHLIVRSLGDELAKQSSAAEEDPILARDAAAFYLKLSESLLAEMPDNARLAESVASGFTQYAYAFVAFEADKMEAKDSKAAVKLRERAAKLYRRANTHAMKALELQSPGFSKALGSSTVTGQPRLSPDNVGLAYWAAASWGGMISLSKDDPDIVADLPNAMRLAGMAWALQPDYGQGDLSVLMGNFEASRPGGSAAKAAAYFDRALAATGGRSMAALMAQAENLALPADNRASFESLLRRVIELSSSERGLSAVIAKERAQWLLDSAEDLF